MITITSRERIVAYGFFRPILTTSKKLAESQVWYHSNSHFIGNSHSKKKWSASRKTHLIVFGLSDSIKQPDQTFTSNFFSI